jgi:hypothetical protein
MLAGNTSLLDIPGRLDGLLLVDLEMINPVRYASNNPVNRVDPSGLADVGMHWISQSVVKKLGSNQLDEAARQLFKEFSTVPEVYIHNYDTWFPDGRRVTHAEYNGAIKEWVDKVLKKGKITEKTAESMIRMFTKEGFSDEAKTLFSLSNESADIIKRYWRGYVESVDLAFAIVEHGGEDLKRTPDLKYLVQYAQITSKHGDDVNKLRQLIDKETYDTFIVELVSKPLK